jgi:hypothetical protein
MKGRSMRMNPIILVLLFLTMASGCDRPKRPVRVPPPKSTLLQDEQNVELAKIILRPVRDTLDVERDPFQPLSFRKENVEEIADPNENFFQNIRVLGITQVNDESRVLIKSPSGKKVYRINDRLGDFQIEMISNDSVIFGDGDQTWKVKRGGQREN